MPKELTENPIRTDADAVAQRDLLSDVLRTIRLSGSLQFCFTATGAWQTDAAPSLARLMGNAGNTMPFHIVAEGACWMRIGDRELVLAEGDVIAFPFGTGHQLGAGDGGKLVTPVQDLPPKPWREIPVLHYGDGQQRVRLLCGFLRSDGMNFRPLREALPQTLHVRTRDSGAAAWLNATIGQIVAEVDSPRTGGLSMLERLTEIIFIELLRHQICSAQPGSTGWLAALADPPLGRCLSLIHNDPGHDWSVPALSTASGLSRSTLAERFETVLDTSPMRYVRDWRLCLASMALSTTAKGIAAIAHEAGYGTEAAFNRAFSRTYGAPPAAWRSARRGQTA
ncbi:AraC family transcriptional regulator [Neomesorhizobium albiziae]|uniref:AraC family transcriptional regulator n=1 Tax=Neomesorhizobium albiziae TaxID=335020 RepID=UPI00122CA185|nr:AraC family transcriptional regulator [Mesorhizobium albiziae]